MKSLFKLAILGMVLFFTYQANAQAFFGLYGGMNTAGLELSEWKTNADGNDTKPTFKSIRRLTFGATCELPLSRYIFFQPELAWTTKGGIMYIDSATGDIFGAGLTTYKTVNNLDLHYVQLPLLMKVRWQLTNPKPIYPNEGTGKPLYFEFYLGPVVNFLLMPRANYSQTTQYTPPGGTPEAEKKTVYNGSTQAGLKKLDFSLALGGNFKYKLSKKTFIYLDARYSMNFMNINNGALTNLVPNKKDATKLDQSYPTLKNASNLAITLGVNTTFTKRRYWNHPRMKKRRF
ncbi:MAG: outer membrane beta-barrel protein [Bacteroidia bacterium]